MVITAASAAQYHVILFLISHSFLVLQLIATPTPQHNIAARASNTGSRIFNNYGEGPYYGLVPVDFIICFTIAYSLCIAQLTIKILLSRHVSSSGSRQSG